jgi:hypothetical protein
MRCEKPDQSDSRTTQIEPDVTPEYKSMKVMNNQKRQMIQFEKVSMVFQIRLREEICRTKNIASKELKHNSEHKSMKVMNRKKRQMIQFGKVSMVFQI